MPLAEGGQVARLVGLVDLCTSIMWFNDRRAMLSYLKHNRLQKAGS